MTIKLYFEEIRYDAYSRGDTGYAIRVALTNAVYHQIPAGESAQLSDTFLFCIPDGWSREKATRFAEALKRAAYDATWGDASHFPNLIDGVRKMIAERHKEIYEEFAQEE